MTMPCDPPFHTNIPVLALDTYTEEQRWPDWQEIHSDKQQKFQIRVRNALRTKKDLDTLLHPDPN